ncbi:MFS transporter [uncultured Kordia sp.]|uniref:MFS transporter n=1 Tax=uncultured Kordia sp. TaxID=507699 RepID=UPI002609C709|nr:MFS transporter [uncultured Kordia sp.]
MKVPKHILPIIVISQFLCTSLWFAGNGIMSELKSNFNLAESALGYLTSSVQLGFIIGTLIFALLSIADRYSSSKVFMMCAFLGAAFNICIIWEGNTYASILAFRLLTGFFLAGIYPVGMKIAADYFEKGLGKSLGYLVGALVIGTALPHLLKDIKGNLPWEFVLVITSTIATLGGILMVSLVPNGPYRKQSQHINLSSIPNIFKKPSFRAAAFGYFGHMWELYAFWAFVPIILSMYTEKHAETAINVSFLSFIVIGIGSLGCVIGGYLAQRFNVKKIAFISLFLSCICCLLLPFMLFVSSQVFFIIFLLFWGMVVIADSPLFSTLVAHNAPAALKGTALTIVNSIGFAITILSIQLLNELRTYTDAPIIYIILAVGPIFGLIAIRKRKK